MSEPYTYTDRDGDELAVRSVDYDGTPHAALGILRVNGDQVAVHVHPDEVWSVCEAILTAAGVHA